MQTIQSILILFNLSQPNAIKAYDIAKKLQNFIRQIEKTSKSTIIQCTNDQKLFISISIQSLEKLCTSNIQKSWIKLLFIDSYLNYYTSSNINDQIVDFLHTLLCQQTTTKINFTPQLRTIKSKTFIGKVSNKLSKISSMINIDYFKQTQQFNKKDIQKQKNLQKSLPIDIPAKIVLQYGVYLRKKLQNYKFCIKTREKYQKKQKIMIKTDNHLLQLRQYVWKIINLINHHTIMVKLYKKIAFMESQYKPLVVATFTMLCRDCLILYPYIIKLIEIESQLVTQKYTKIVQQKQPKDIKKIKLQAFSKDLMFLEIDNLLKELTPINETIFYLFCGKLHYSYITFQVPNHYFLNTANPKLDQIHNVIKQVKLIVQKQQKSKLYRTQLSIKLNQSVNKVVEKLDNSRSIATMQDIKSVQSKDTQESNFETEEIYRIQRIQRKKKVYSFFQEKTQVI